MFKNLTTTDKLVILVNVVIIGITIYNIIESNKPVKSNREVWVVNTESDWFKNLNK